MNDELVNISLLNYSDLRDKFRQMPGMLNGLLHLTSEAVAATLAQYVQNDKLSGEVVEEKSGLLKDSIATLVEETDHGTVASVFVDGDVPYAAILEYGGVTKAHIIAAVQGKALAFGFQGKQAFFRQVHHPGSVIAEHSYLRSSLADQQDAILAAFEDTLADVL